MPTISLCSFLKISACGVSQKTKEYSKYLTPGGYDFYLQLKQAAGQLTVDGMPFEQCMLLISKIKRDVERKHNSDGLEALQKWVAGTEGIFFKAPKGSCSSPKGYLTIRIEPEFGIAEGSQRRLVQIWNAKGTVRIR